MEQKQNLSEKEIRKQSWILFISGVALYCLFNYLPLQIWIRNEYIYLTVKILFYIVLSFFLLHFKKKLDLELERPLKEISWCWLLPLLIPACTNFISVEFFDSIQPKEVELGVFFFDIITDFFVSVGEDTIFVDIALGLLLPLLRNKRGAHKNVLSLFIISIFFTAIHCYSFLYSKPDVAAFSLVYVFLLTFECGYLAIYFDSPLIPILVHYLFNALDFVAFESFFEIEKITGKYILFCSLMILFAVFYTMALAKISTEQELKVLGEKKLHEMELKAEEIHQDADKIQEGISSSEEEKREETKAEIQADLEELEKEKAELEKDLASLKKKGE